MGVQYLYTSLFETADSIYPTIDPATPSRRKKPKSKSTSLNQTLPAFNNPKYSSKAFTTSPTLPLFCR